jgi:hypothetical protein
MEENLTLGQERVGVNFNPSQKEIVKNIKQKTAELIDLIDSITLATLGDPSIPEPSINGEVRRLKALAMTSYEEAAMWAVKAATK